jgi:hypothetical protein
VQAPADAGLFEPPACTVFSKGQNMSHFGRSSLSLLFAAATAIVIASPSGPTLEPFEPDDRITNMGVRGTRRDRCRKEAHLWSGHACTNCAATRHAA